MSGEGAASRGRGEPLLVLGLILGSWMGIRVLFWQSPFVSKGPVPASLAMSRPARSLDRSIERPIRPVRRDADISRAIPGPGDAPNARPVPPPWAPATSLSQRPPFLPALAPPASRIVGQQLLLAAAFASVELPSRIANHLRSSAGRKALALAGEPLLPARPAPSPQGARRWSGDGWAFFRQDNAGPLAVGQPFYGRSQAGALLRYRLAPSSGHGPIGYVRATRALAGPGETELAAGLAARPLPSVPVSVAAELRVTAEPAGREVRPAAFAVTELPPLSLPGGLRGEVYAQAGYVGGRFATAFADGQARVDARVTSLGPDADVRAGGGIWGGAQKHAARLDIGPSAAVDFRLGETQSHLTLDYRIRVAGDARPKSGPALTFSAGF